MSAPSRQSAPTAPLGSEFSAVAVVGIALLPWVIAAALTGGLWIALSVIAFAVLLFVSGYAVVWAVLPLEARSGAMVLAPSAGMLALSGLSAFWLRLGLSLATISAIWLALFVVGLIGLWRNRRGVLAARVTNVVPLLVFAVLICAIYFVPGAFNDAVPLKDGGFSWFSIDTQLYHSMVSSIRNGTLPPRMAGSFTAELCYHFGPYAVAAAVSLFARISEADALVRVTRGVEQWALLFSCLGLGTMLSLRVNGKRFGGIMSVAGLFFYGSVLSLFSGVVRPRPVASFPFFFDEGGQFPTNAGSFSHFLLGTSLLHGLETVTAIIGLCLVLGAERELPAWRTLAALFLPAFMTAVHSAAGLYCLGAVAVLLFWDRLSKWRSWFFLAVMAALFVEACNLMGYGHAPHVAAAGVQLSRLPVYWWTFTVWLVVALGIRLISFGWVTRKWNDPIAAFVLISFAGLLAFSWLGALWAGTEHYGVYYLQAILAVFAFSRLPEGFWRTSARREWVTQWLSYERHGLLLFTIGGALIGATGYAVHRAAGISHFRGRIILCVLLLALLAIMVRMWKKSPQFSNVASGIVVAVLMVGFLAWIPPWLKYRTSGQTYNVTLTSGEVRGLMQLRKIATRGDRFATNKHYPTGGTGEHTADSYAYGTLSGLPVLLEGSFDGAEENLPGFAKLNHDNDLLFATTNPDSLRTVAQSYDIHWLVLRPGTNLGLPTPLPTWLTDEQDTGDLKIYRIN